MQVKDAKSGKKITRTAIVDSTRIPPRTMEALNEYRRILDAGETIPPPGGFMQAVFNNDLLIAVQKADPANYEALRDIVFWVANNLPELFNRTSY